MVAASERGVIVLRASDGGEVLALPGDPVDARFAPAGDLIASAGADGVLRVHSFPAGELIVSLPADPPVLALSGRLLAWGDGRRVRLAPLELAALREPPAELLRQAQAAAGLQIRGFLLAR